MWRKVLGYKPTPLVLYFGPEVGRGGGGAYPELHGVRDGKLHEVFSVPVAHDLTTSCTNTVSAKRMVQGRLGFIQV